jgi:Glycosyl hydrolases family 2
MTKHDTTKLDPLPSYTVRVHRLDSAVAELYVTFADLSPDVEVHGRVMGPRCPGVQTVEVAYYLRPTGTLGDFRLIIPDPVLWSSEQPYMYEGPVEYRRNGAVVGSVSLSIGIKLGR